jgi:ABC-2 type transport system permease protein
MRAGVIGAVLRRETLEIFRNRLLVISIVVPPLILIALPLLVGIIGGVNDEAIPASFVEQLVASHPAWADLSDEQVMIAFVLQQFLVTFLIIPGYIPLSIATFSIVGEKQSRSLEAVLATPIRTGELLGGKTIASLVPGVLAAWLAYGVMTALIGILLGGRMAAVVLEPAWLASVFVLGPAVGLVSVVAGVIVSSRVNDPRTAQQIGGVVLIPIISLVVLQAVGRVVLDAQVYLLLAAVTAVVGIVGLRIGAAVFDREQILTRWK